MLRFLRAVRDAARTLLASVVVVLMTVILGTFVIIIATFSPNSRVIRPTMRLWGLVFMKVCGVAWEVEGLEHLERDKPYVLVSNHQSNLDPPFHIAVLCEKVSVRFLAKAELFRIPLFAQAMRRIKIVETDRAAGASAHRRINEQVSVVIERGLSLVIYPEGTRSLDGSVHPLKKGAFRIAIDNDMPVVPITTVGLHAAWTPGEKLVRGGRARMMIHEPIPTAAMTPADIDGLRDRVATVITDSHARLTH